MTGFFTFFLSAFSACLTGMILKTPGSNRTAPGNQGVNLEINTNKPGPVHQIAKRMAVVTLRRLVVFLIMIGLCGLLSWIISLRP
jgi:hypothetical protein